MMIENHMVQGMVVRKSEQCSAATLSGASAANEEHDARLDARYRVTADLTGEEVMDLTALEARVAAASPTPWRYDAESGAIRSEELESRVEEIEELELHPDDPRWDSLPDPTVALVTPSTSGRGQGDRDAALIAEACSAIPALVRRIRYLERALAASRSLGAARAPWGR